MLKALLEMAAEQGRVLSSAVPRGLITRLEDSCLQKTLPRDGVSCADGWARQQAESSCVSWGGGAAACRGVNFTRCGIEVIGVVLVKIQSQWRAAAAPSGAADIAMPACQTRGRPPGRAPSRGLAENLTAHQASLPGLAGT